VQHKPLGGFAAFQQFDALGVVFRAQPQGHPRLRFAAGEQRGVGWRRDAGLDGDRPKAQRACDLWDTSA